jgi:glycosyltransferase involved in cell wall biosynthesis
MLSADALACSPLKKRLAARLFQDRCFARTDVLHVTSDAEAQEARIYGLSMPICLFANGVGDAFGSPDWAAPRRNEIVTLGRKHHMKGLDTLLRAWAHVEPLASDWSLKIAGPDEGGYEHTLRELADRLRLRRVSFLPALYGERKRRFLTEAKLFILPSRSENFAMTVPEALLCGTPVISTRGAPWSGLNENGCGWWVDREETALAAAIQSATISIGNRQRRAMGEAGRAWILKDFTWHRVAERAETCYLQAQERHRWPS